MELSAYQIIANNLLTLFTNIYLSFSLQHIVWSIYLNHLQFLLWAKRTQKLKLSLQYRLEKCLESME